MSDFEILAQRLQEARVRSGKTQGGAARLLGCTAQAISNWERGYTRIDCVSLFRLLEWYGADVLSFFRSCGLLPDEEQAERPESRLIKLFRKLDETDRERLLRIAGVLSGDAFLPSAAAQEQAAGEKTIPLFRFLAAAGIPSPQPGEDYEDLVVDASLDADFAVTIAGDSMEPWIPDGGRVFCKRTVALSDGDIGIFYAKDGMVCKQFLRDSEGNIYLFSLNRLRADADVYFPASSGMPLMCYGKVLMERSVPLPD